MITYKLDKNFEVDFEPTELGSCSYTVTLHDFDNLESFNMGIVDYIDFLNILSNPRSYMLSYIERY